MGQKGGSFLLDDGDELRLSDSVTLVYRSSVPVPEVELSRVQQREIKLFSSRYLITGRTLGVGGYGRVMIAVDQGTQRQVACKIIDLDRLNLKLHGSNLRHPTSGDKRSSSDQTKSKWPAKFGNCYREFDILKDLSHPNIVTIEKVFWSQNNIYIFQELVPGGDLFSYMAHKQRLDNVEAAVIVWQILKGVQYLHERNIVHRDLKPDNILLSSLESGARVIITDFGNARLLPQEKTTGVKSAKARLQHRMFSTTGTAEYMAPEIRKRNRAIPTEQGYSAAVDMWSIGSITATLVTGDVPFTDRDHPDYEHNPEKVILAVASECNLSAIDDKNHEGWKQVGARPKDFIKRLLVLNEDKRMTAQEALAHPWFSHKSYAAEFDALYRRATRDWQPRKKVFSLVESISDVATNSINDSTADYLSQEIVSRYFTAPRRDSSNYDFHQSYSGSQSKRANTPLPSIREEYENHSSQFASPPDPVREVQYPVRGSAADHFQDYTDHLSRHPSTEGILTGREAEVDENHHSAHISQGLALPSGTWSQNWQRQLAIAAHGSIDPDFHLDNSQYFNTAYDNHHKTPDIEQDSILVCETPRQGVKRFRTYSNISGRDMTSGTDDESQFSPTDKFSTRYFSEELSKRRKLGHECY
jgi:pheromone a factor receptor